MRLVSFRDPAGHDRVGRLDGDRVTVLQAPTMLDWLRGNGHETAGRDHALAEVMLRAPVPEPPSVRDFSAFEGHVATAWGLRDAEIPQAWYDAPSFYFSNAAAIHDPGQAVRRPPASQRLDFELEVAAVIGADGEIAGFTLFNDWSARDVQTEEMTIGMGPAKAKDFASTLGPWLVTPDELAYRDGRLHLEATVTLNGAELTRTRAGEQHWTWPQLVAHAARDTRLRPGDVLGSGTLHRGCLLELIAEELVEPRWLQPGDEVVLEAEGLGRLASPIV